MIASRFYPIGRRCILRVVDVDLLPWLQNPGSGFPFYITANCRFLRSVMSIAPGACVIANSGLMCAMTDWGIIPQAQNTGSSSVLTSTGSP